MRSPSRRLTEQAFQNYLAVMMVSLLAPFPDMSVNSFGRVTLYATAVWSAWVVIRFFQTITQRLDWCSRIRALRRHISSRIGFAMLLVSALRMALNRGELFDVVRRRRPASAVFGDDCVLGIASPACGPRFERERRAVSGVDQGPSP